MGFLWTSFRTAVYATIFLIAWAAAVTVVRPMDDRLGGALPSWTYLPGLWIAGLGAILAFICLSVFVHRGQGTPAPFDPPRRFVVSGPYRYMRNPMYVGAFMYFFGFGLMQHSPSIVLLALLTGLGFHLFVVLVEEPGMEKRFGESYLSYKEHVRRWLPRRPLG